MVLHSDYIYIYTHSLSLSSELRQLGSDLGSQLADFIDHPKQFGEAKHLKEAARLCMVCSETRDGFKHLGRLPLTLQAKGHLAWLQAP